MEQHLAVVRQVGGSQAAKRLAWQEILEHWSGSGLPQSDFCRQHALPVKKFLKWKAKLRTNTKLPTTAAATACGALIELAALPVGEDRIELHLGTARLLLPVRVSLPEVLRALQEAAC